MTDKPDDGNEDCRTLELSGHGFVFHEVAGFTPANDYLTKVFDCLTALIYGMVWRYCQHPSGECTASQRRMGERMKVSTRTITRKLSKLVDAGYLECEEREGMTNIYRLPSKIILPKTESHKNVGQTVSGTYDSKSDKDTKQETNQESDVVNNKKDVIKEMENLGLHKKVARKLANENPEEELRVWLQVVRGLSRQGKIKTPEK